MMEQTKQTSAKLFFATTTPGIVMGANIPHVVFKWEQTRPGYNQINM